MDVLELYQRIQRWEDLHTEFKEQDAHSDDIAAALVAFANTDGGQLIFGVSKDRVIIGVDDADRVMQRIDQIAYHNCEPPVTVIQETIPTEQGLAVVVNIPKGDQRPYRTQRGDYFIRTTSGRRRASRQELLRLFQSVESLYYDETLVLRASLSDLDYRRFTVFFEQSYQRLLQSEQEVENLLRNMRLVREQAGVWHPTLAGLLCFGREPQSFFPYAQVNAARIPGDSLATAPSDAKQIGGTLFDMLEDTARFLQIHLPSPHIIHGFAPEQRTEIPEEALRELLVNALVHRDYTVASPIRLLIFDRRIEIRTPGALPNTVTIEAILLGAAHVLRNPTIYTMFSRAGLVTSLGSGVLRAKELLEQHAHTTLELKVVANEFVVIITRPG
ncbi:RNA-binding domain-containing protein [Roseiflexus castenholzii]|jgi:ATP-dependent DNA helicase RecG|uniref:Putative transcriptional regulator n=1 Tax=Roseiflexus castenholzii (strain DSM 13941 / HLO8) TaxID=383372 RepID=A7NJM8_ROSCS|nr:RNA-binding domain-containing protein [Roseiflexus castenholzii]ABU57698.1 putative transcriptional regulator [Roseiflexus castenholzii DSM 13941]